MKGKIKFFNSIKGFGFIKADSGSEIFFHESAIQNNAELEEGDSVVFDTEQNDRGQKAINVKKEN